MDFFMPACTRLAELSRILALMAALSLAGGCDEQSRWQRFEIQNVELRWSNGRLNAELHQELEFSTEARDALQHGVPLTLLVELIVRNTANQIRAGESLEHYEIRYLPLSKRFQLTLPGGDEIRTFPRLRHLLAELANLRLVIRTGALPEGSYEVLTRISLDRRKMPISMRLPTMFDSEWKHDSHWSSWPLEITPQA
jgi:hypothetical protein